MILTPVRERSAVIDVLFDAHPRTPREMAGLILWYDRNGWIWLHVTGDSEHGRQVVVTRRDGATTTASFSAPAPDGPLSLRAHLIGPLVSFWVNDAPIVSDLPAWTLSDDHGSTLRFTGLHVGARVDDLDGRGWSSDLTKFSIHYP